MITVLFIQTSTVIHYSWANLVWYFICVLIYYIHRYIPFGSSMMELLESSRNPLRKVFGKIDKINGISNYITSNKPLEIPLIQFFLQTKPTWFSDWINGISSVLLLIKGLAISLILSILQETCLSMVWLVSGSSIIDGLYSIYLVDSEVH